MIFISVGWRKAPGTLRQRDGLALACSLSYFSLVLVGYAWLVCFGYASSLRKTMTRSLWLY